MSRPSILFEPALVESVVQEELGGRPQSDPLAPLIHDPGEHSTTCRCCPSDRELTGLALRYRKLLDATYQRTGPARLLATRRIHRALFSKLGWVQFFESFVAPMRSNLVAIAVSSADREEGCFVDERRHLQIRLRRERWRNRESLRGYLQHERVHVSDILDPAFGYRIESVDEPTRQRYAALWCSSIDERLQGKTLEPVTHTGLLQRARAQSRPRCPLCALPTVQWRSVSTTLATQIKAVVPPGSVDGPVCEHCLEWIEITCGTQ